MPKKKTIAELQKELAAKQSQLRRLGSRRSSLAKQLTAFDRQIAMLSGTAPAKPTNGRRRAAKKKAAKKAVRKAARRRRGKPLPEYIRKVLARAGGGMRVKDVVVAVKRAGYRTKSPHFYTSVATALREGDAFVKASRGVYRLRT